MAKEEEQLYNKLDTKEGATLIYKFTKSRDRRSRDISDMAQCFTYLLTIVDRFTRWPEAIPLSDISALTCARAFLYHWVSRYGVPSILTSDRGRQFVSELWRKIAALLGTTTNTTTSYHPQSNGLVE